MTAQLQSLFQQLPDAEQREFVQVIVDQSTPEEAELDRRELEPNKHFCFGWVYLFPIYTSFIAFMLPNSK